MVGITSNTQHHTHASHREGQVQNESGKKTQAQEMPFDAVKRRFRSRQFFFFGYLTTPYHARKSVPCKARQEAQGISQPHATRLVIALFLLLVHTCATRPRTTEPQSEKEPSNDGRYHQRLDLETAGPSATTGLLELAALGLDVGLLQRVLVLFS